MSRAIFMKEALADFRKVASVAPSSRYLAQAMVRPLPLVQARVVVELGCGTGVMTRALLDQLPADATLLAFEINPRFTQYLREDIPDPRLVLIDASAETIEVEVRARGFHRVDAVVSSLGLAFIPAPQRLSFLNGMTNLLDSNGVFTQFHYVHGMQFQNGQLARFDLKRLLRRHFRSVERGIVWRNLPPAYVFECREPLPARFHSNDVTGAGRSSTDS